VQHDEPVLGDVAVREQRGGDLLGGQHLMVVQELQQLAVSAGELAQRREQRIGSPHAVAPRRKPPAGRKRTTPVMS